VQPPADEWSRPASEGCEAGFQVGDRLGRPVAPQRGLGQDPPCARGVGERADSLGRAEEALRAQPRLVERAREQAALGQRVREADLVEPAEPLGPRPQPLDLANGGARLRLKAGRHVVEAEVQQRAGLCRLRADLAGDAQRLEVVPLRAFEVEQLTVQPALVADQVRQPEAILVAASELDALAQRRQRGADRAAVALCEPEQAQADEHPQAVALLAREQQGLAERRLGFRVLRLPVVQAAAVEEPRNRALWSCASGPGQHLFEDGPALGELSLFLEDRGHPQQRVRCSAALLRLRAVQGSARPAPPAPRSGAVEERVAQAGQSLDLERRLGAGVRGLEQRREYLRRPLEARQGEVGEPVLAKQLEARRPALLRGQASDQRQGGGSAARPRRWRRARESRCRRPGSGSAPHGRSRGRARSEARSARVSRRRVARVPPSSSPTRRCRAARRWASRSS
jgi:hypothetical protein